ncbi:hypothetical protein [Kineococcus sp. NUM-3379]
MIAADVPVVLGSRDRRSGRVLLSPAGTAEWWGGEPHQDAAFHRRLAAEARRCGNVLGVARQEALAELRAAFEALEGSRPQTPEVPGTVREHLAAAADTSRRPLERAWHLLGAERRQARELAGETRRWARRVTAPGAAVLLAACTPDPGSPALEIAVLDAATGAALLHVLVDLHPCVSGHLCCCPAGTDVPRTASLRDVAPRLLAVTGGRSVLAFDASAQRRLLSRSATGCGADLDALYPARRWEDLTLRAADCAGTGAGPSRPASRALPRCRQGRDLLLALTTPGDAGLRAA